MMTAKKAEEPQEPKKGGFSGWLNDLLEPLVIVAVDRAISNLRGEIKADLVDMETKLLGQFTQLPGMVASQIANVALDAEQVAEQVAQRFGSFLNPGGLAQDVADRTGGILGNLVNPGAIAREVIDGILPNMPHFPGIPGFGLVGQQQPQADADQEDYLARAKEIRKEMEESDASFNKPAPEMEMKAERTAGTTQQPVRKSKADEIRKRLEARDPNKLPRKDRP
jgi:hypothetical protein